MSRFPPSRVVASPVVRGALACLALVHFAACRTAVDPAAIDDALLAARVKTAIVNDPGLGTLPIEVRARDGIIRLSGRVASEDELQRLLRLVQGVSGVRGVESGVRVGEVPPAPPGSAPESEVMEEEADPRLLAVGASVGFRNARIGQLDAATSLSPLFRFGAGTGLAPAFDLNWFTADLFAGEDGPRVGNVNVRPIMIGLGYTIRGDRLSLTTSVVGGYAFNSLHLEGEVPGGSLALKVTNGPVWRPGVSIWYDASRRVALNVFAGYIMTRPTVTWLVDGAFEDRALRTDTVLVSTGVAWKVF